jgi:hypothetical protein
MIAFPAGTKVWIAGGVTDMRLGMNKPEHDISPIALEAVKRIDAIFDMQILKATE